MKDADLLFAFFVSLPVTELTASRLMALAEPFGISETSLRSTLSRMHARNLIEIRKEGRTAFYRLGARGRRIGSNVGRRFSDLDWSSWDGSYWGAAFSQPDSAGRYRRQKKLRAYQFRALYPGLWIRPYHPAENIAAAFEEMLQAGGFDLFRCSFAREISIEKINQLYDLPPTATALYQALTLAGQSITKAPTLTPELAFVEWISRGDSLVKALAEDPQLPAALLPAGWPAPELRKAFITWNRTYFLKSQPFVEQALN